MTGMSGSNMPPNDFSGYHAPISGPSGGGNRPGPNPAAHNPANPGAAFAGGPSPSPEPAPTGQPGAIAPTPAARSAARAVPTTRPVNQQADRRGRLRSSRDGRDPNERFQGFITAVGLAIGLLFIAGGGLLNATVPMTGLDPVATATSRGAPLAGQSTSSPTLAGGTLTPAAFATTTTTIVPTASTTAGLSASATATPRPTATATTASGTATPTATATPVPAKLSISPTTVNNATCAANSALATLNLNNSGGVPLDWTAAVDSTNSGNISLSDSTGTITGGHLESGGTDTVSVNNTSSSALTGTSITITFNTTPTSAGPVTVTITCAP